MVRISDKDVGLPDELCGWARISVVAWFSVLEEHCGTCKAHSHP